MPLEQGQQKMIKHLQNTMRKGALIVNTNMEPTTKQNPGTVVTFFKLLLKPEQQAQHFLYIL